MTYVTASFSGGKDSTAMVLHMLDLGEQLDEVIYCDTTVDFPMMADHIAKVRAVVEAHGVKFTILRSKKTFEDMLYRIPVNSPKFGKMNGYGWPNMAQRWCTVFLKTRIMDNYKKKMAKESGDDIITCVGLAADEVKRTKREHNQGQRWPLIEWGWTEADALRYCRDLGYDWSGLYDHYDRVSCWCCPLQPINELRTLWKYYPELWQTLLEWQHEIDKNPKAGRARFFKDGRTIDDFGRQFMAEAKHSKAQKSLDYFGEEADE